MNEMAIISLDKYEHLQKQVEEVETRLKRKDRIIQDIYERNNRLLEQIYSRPDYADYENEVREIDLDKLIQKAVGAEHQGTQLKIKIITKHNIIGCEVEHREEKKQLKE